MIVLRAAEISPSLTDCGSVETVDHEAVGYENALVFVRGPRPSVSLIIFMAQSLRLDSPI